MFAGNTPSEGPFGNFPIQGQAAFTAPGTYSWTVPNGVTSISAVAVSGGQGGGSFEGGRGASLRYLVSQAVTPGEVLTVTVGAGSSGVTSTSGPAVLGGDSQIVRGGSTILLANNSGAAGVGSGGDGGVNGGLHGGAGGAGGYSGNGGNGGAVGFAPSSPSPGAVGAGGGGGGGNGGLNDGAGNITGAGDGGGVGILGQGANGAANGGAGSGGSGQQFGGGGRPGGVVGGSPQVGGNGGSGAVRIVWGPGRQYPALVPDV